MDLAFEIEQTRQAFAFVNRTADQLVAAGYLTEARELRATFDARAVTLNRAWESAFARMQPYRLG